MIRFPVRCCGRVVSGWVAISILVLATLFFTPPGQGAPGAGSAFTQTLDKVFQGDGLARALDALSIRAIFAPADVKAGGEVELLLQITVGEGSYIYSVKSQGPFSPSPTHLVFQMDGFLSPKGPLRESLPESLYDAPFDRAMRVHKRVFTLSQLFRVAPDVRPGPQRVSGEMKFHICDGNVCSTLKGKPFQVQFQVVAASKLP